MVPRKYLTSKAVAYCYGLVLLLAVVAFSALLVPVYIALTAGIASTSLLVFGGLLIAALGIFILAKTSHWMLWAIIAISLAGIIVPQASYLSAARQYGAKLTFHPTSYAHFSGKTTLQPSEILFYPSASGGNLPIALYRPKHKAISPAVVVVHGGGWRYGSYMQTGEWPKALTSAGYSVFSIEYTKSSPHNHTWAQTPADISNAMNHIRSHSAELKIDLNKISLLGQSAGGHLALLQAYSAHDVESVISLYAPVDPAYDYKTSRDKSAELNFFGGNPAEMPDEYQQLNPLRFISSTSPRTLIIQGTLDDLVHHTNAQNLSSTLNKHGVKNKLVMLPFTGHSFENQQGGFSTQIAEQMVIKFLRESNRD